VPDTPEPTPDPTSGPVTEPLLEPAAQPAGGAADQRSAEPAALGSLTDRAFAAVLFDLDGTLVDSTGSPSPA
jgi:hypothetical protein